MSPKPVDPSSVRLAKLVDTSATGAEGRDFNRQKKERREAELQTLRVEGPLERRLADEMAALQKAREVISSYDCAIEQAVELLGENHDISRLLRAAQASDARTPAP